MTKIKAFLVSMKHYVATHKLLTTIALVIVVAGGGYAIGHNTNKTEETFTIIPSSKTQRVKVSGNVKPTSEASLSFEKSGVVRSVYGVVGQEVKAGTVLAALSLDDASASLSQAKASLANQEAILAQLQAGTRQEELDVKLQAEKNAQLSLDNTYTTIPDSIRDANVKVSDAIKTKLSTVFTLQGSRYVLSFSSCDLGLQSSVETKRNSLETSLTTFQNTSSAVSIASSKETLDTNVQQAYTVTQEANAFLDLLSSLVSASCSAGNTSYDSYRSSISSARTNLNPQ
jgi:HlyD family secretion protein